MQDFNDYVKNRKEQGDSNSQNFGNGASGSNASGNLSDMVKKLAGRFDGKNQNDLMRAVYEEAKRGKQNGTLKNSDIDNFVKTLSPMLDSNQRKMLLKVSEELKKI